MKNSIKCIVCFLMVCFAMTLTNSAEAQSRYKKKKSKDAPALIKHDGHYLLSGLKMSEKDTKQLLKLLNKAGDRSFLISVNNKRSFNSYGSLKNAKMVVEKIVNDAELNSTATTCTEVSTSNECYKVNTTIEEGAVSPGVRKELNSLMSRYLKM